MILHDLPKYIQYIAIAGISKALFNIYKFQRKEIENLQKENQELKSNKICTNCKELEV